MTPNLKTTSSDESFTGCFADGPTPRDILRPALSFSRAALRKRLAPKISARASRFPLTYASGTAKLVNVSAKQPPLNDLDAYH